MTSIPKEPVRRTRCVVIGASRGGMQALEKVLSGLPADFSLPIIVVLHRGKDSSDEIIVNFLQQSCAIRVSEVEDKMTIAAGEVHVAPADYHLLVEKDHFVLSTDEPEHYARPAIDLLFESAALAHREELLGVLLTGANEDGVQGLSMIKECGGITLVQDPKTAEADTMPLAAIREKSVDYVMTLEQISSFLSSLSLKPSSA